MRDGDVGFGVACGDEPALELAVAAVDVDAPDEARDGEDTLVAPEGSGAAATDGDVRVSSVFFV